MSAWKEPSPYQAGFLHSFRPINFFIGGRGAGKTAVLVKKYDALAIMSPGITLMLTEQTNKDIRDILEPCWQAMVDPRTHTSRGFEGSTVKRYHNGSQVWFRARHAKSVNAQPPFHGPTVGAVGHDELTLDRRADVITVSRAMLRQPGAMFLTCDVTATPRPSWVKQFMMANGLANPIKTDADRFQISESGNHAAFYSPTRGNVYNRGLHDRLASDMSDQDVDAMLEGLWVDKDGKCWKFVEEEHPHGNMVDLPYDPRKPWILGVDLGGANSAWGLYQREDLRAGRRKIGCLVLKAEWTPQDVPAWEILRQIKDYTSTNRYNRPDAIKIGADYKSGGSTGFSADMIFSDIPGWGERVENITGWYSHKDVQDHRASYAICNNLGERRFCISKQLDKFYEGPTRGLLDVMRNDMYPEPGSLDYFRKEKGKGIYHEDSRDQWLYTMVSVFPPSYAPQENWAA
jgi:hypothetical protein